MALSVRFLVPPNSVVPANYRQYTANASGIVDVPFPDAESVVNYIPRSFPDPDSSGLHLCQRMIISGSTADRPLTAGGQLNWPPPTMFDTTLNKQIFWSTSQNQWIDATGAAV